MPRPLYGERCPPEVTTRTRGALSVSASPGPRRSSRSRSVTATGDRACARAAARAMSRHSYTLEQRIDQLVRRAPRGFGLEAEQDAVAQDVVRDFLDVLGRHVVAAREPRVRTRDAVERDRGARARAVLQHAGEIVAVALRRARREHDLHDVLLERLGQMLVEHRETRGHDFFLRDRRRAREKLLVGAAPAALVAVELEDRALA